MGVAQLALLRVCGLQALLETATIGHAPENAGDELRVVVQAESEEELILIIEIDIQPGVERAAMFKQFWRIGEIREKVAVGGWRIELQQTDGIGVQPIAGENVHPACCDRKARRTWSARSERIASKADGNGRPGHCSCA